MVTNSDFLLVPPKKVLTKPTQLRPSFFTKGNYIMTFTTNGVEECVLLKQLWWKARIWLNIISFRLCHHNMNDFHIVKNAWAVFVNTISTVLKISIQKSKLSQSWLAELIAEEENIWSTNQKKKTYVFRQSGKRFYKKNNNKILKKTEEAELP